MSVERPWRVAFSLCLVVLVLVAPSRIADAHPAPFSYIDVRIGDGPMHGRIVLHDLDVAHDLGLPSADALATDAGVREHGEAIARLISARFTLTADGRIAAWQATGVRALPDQSSIEVVWQSAQIVPGRIDVKAEIFPYDPNPPDLPERVRRHLPRPSGGPQSRPIIARALHRARRQGLWAVFTAFTESGIHHIAIGPDHILFIVGLLLLGGSIRRLLAIVTAFTLGHSLTLALATLQIVEPAGAD